MVDSRSPRAGAPGITRHWRGVILCMRPGSTACTLGSVDASTLAWLSASICQFVFMFEGSSDVLPAAATTRNSWTFTVNVTIEWKPRVTRRPGDAARWGVTETCNFSNLLSGGGAGGLPLCGVRGRKSCCQITWILIAAWSFRRRSSFTGGSLGFLR